MFNEISPNGQFEIIYEGNEFAMGSPLLGALWLIEKDKETMICKRAGSDFIWSDDSKFLAFSEWRNDNFARYIKILKLSDMAIKDVPADALDPNFVSFKDGLLEFSYRPWCHETKRIITKTVIVDINKIFA